MDMKPFCVRTLEEISKQQDLCQEGREMGSKYPGMSYEDGILTTIDWLLGETDEKPMEE